MSNYYWQIFTIPYLEQRRDERDFEVESRGLMKGTEKD